MLALDLPDRSLGGIFAFYAIVKTIAKVLLPKVFREMRRVLRSDGLLLLVIECLNAVGFVVEESLQRGPTPRPSA